MTPIVLLILVGMWAAVLLPPYLRDRNDTRAAGSQSPVSNKLDALSRSFGHRDRSGYLPVTSSSLGSPQQPGSPLPAGARHPLTRRGVPQLVPSSPEPQSSAFNIIGPMSESPAVEADLDDPTYLLAPDGDVVSGVQQPSVREAIPSTVLAARAARKRRREVLYTLLTACALSSLMAVGLGGPVIGLALLSYLATGAYVAMLIRLQKAKAEREIKVAFLPHGGQGASATELLAQGGGFRPGNVELAPVAAESTAFKVVNGRN